MKGKVMVPFTLSLMIFMVVIIYFIEIHTIQFYVPFIEEGLGRLLPIMIVALLFRDFYQVSMFYFGFMIGTIFGILEIAIKMSNVGFFSIYMLIPVIIVHIPNSILQSYMIRNGLYGEKQLIIIGYVVATLWHWLYNSIFYVV